MQFDIRRISGPEAPVRLWTLRHELLLGIVAGVVVILAAAAYFLSPPANFPENSIITIPQGASAKTFAATLEEAHVIRSRALFYALARATGMDRRLDTGAYVFRSPVWLPQAVWRAAHAEHGIVPIRVTLTEGMTRFDIAKTLVAQLPGFDQEAFLSESSTSEGYLFPETYLFMPGTSAKDIVVRLKSQFSLSIEPITPQIMASKHPFADAVIIASILEREAKSPEDMRIVAGILWNRLAKGMPLQVDAAFGYIHQKNGYTPTAADLDSDSPYNTYKYKGLPPTPISNPGVAAILAAVEPAQTKYLYYLTDKEGRMHYALTFEQHVANKKKYLK